MQLSKQVGHIAVVLLLALSAFLQFYNLDTQQLFLGDQGLHAQVAHDIVTRGLRPLVGPPLAALSGTNMGPIFYYLSALPVWLTGGWPTGGAALVGCFQVATVFLLYRLGRTASGTGFGLTAALLYATSGVVVYWHRMLWPNMVPFCIVVMVWTLLRLAQRKQDRASGWAFVALTGALAMAVQLQPTAFLLIPVVLGGLLLARPRRPVWWASGLAMILVAILFFPLIVNELTTGFSQTRAWIGYLHQTRHAIGDLQDTLILTAREYRGLIGIASTPILGVLAVASLLALVVAALPQKAWRGVRAYKVASEEPSSSGRLLARIALLWAIVYAVALVAGHQQIYPHYYIPLFPLPFLALAYLVGPLWRHRWTAALGLVMVGGLAGWNVQTIWATNFGLGRSALLDLSDVQTPNISLGTLRDVTGVIAHQIGTSPYNFELLSPTDYPIDYKYLLRLQGVLPNHLPVSRKVVVVQPAFDPPANWPDWVTADLAVATPRFWLFHHVALWAWDNQTPLAASPSALAQGQEDPANLVSALAVGSRGQLWRGSPAGISVSANHGQTWSVAVSLRGHGVPDQPAAVLVDPDNQNSVYAATATGVYRSSDGGHAWHMVTACPGRAFALLAPSPMLRLAGTAHGLCISQDGGQTWQQNTLVTSAATADWERAHPQPIYAFWAGSTGEVLAGAGYGLISSMDGRHWHHVSGIDVGLTALVAIPAQQPQDQQPWTAAGTNLYAGTATGLWRSTTAGRTWQPVTAGINTPYVFALATVQTSAGSVLWVATSAGLFQLSPHENSGTLVNGGWPADAAALSLITDGQKLVVGTDSGLYLSADGGGTWVRR